MPRHNIENELAKRAYLSWLKDAHGRHAATLDQVAAAIDAYQVQTRYASFKTFRREKAVGFKEHLTSQTNPATGKPLSKSTMHSRLNTLKAFFEWLSREPGYRKTVSIHDAAYFGLSANDARIATAAREQATPSLEQVVHVLGHMPVDTPLARRDRAVVAFTLLTGARDSAVASMRLKHVDLVAGRVSQDAREVKTKGAKTFTTALFPVGDLALQIVTAWLSELRNNLLFGPDDPIFPGAMRGVNDEGLFATSGLSREPWTSAAPMRAIFKRAFAAAALPYFPPHSFRRTLMRLAYDLDLSPRQLKAWSQNLGHESALTSLVSYGQLSVDEQVQTIGLISKRDNAARGKDLETILLEAAAAIRRETRM